MKKKQCHLSQCGFTLVEVLISVFIFSFALLGVAALQISGLRLSHDSLLRTYADQLAMDMADRVRANRTANQLGTASPYNNSGALATANPGCLGLDTSGNSIDTQCGSAQLALHDFYEWYAMLQGQSATGWHSSIQAKLPNATGVVCIDSTPDDGTPGVPECDNVVVGDQPMFTIKIWWNERKDGGVLNNTIQRYVTSFIP